MAGSSEARSANLDLTGRQRVVPGLEAGAYKGDALAPLIISSGVLSFGTGTLAHQGSAMVPFDGTIIGANYSVEETITATDGTIEVGTKQDPNHFLTALAVATGLTAVTTRNLDILTSTKFVNKSVDAGDTVTFSLPGVTATGTSTGDVSLALVIVPRLS